MEPDSQTTNVAPVIEPVVEEPVTNVDYAALVEKKKDELKILKEKAEEDKIAKLAKQKQFVEDRDLSIELNDAKAKEIMKLIYGFNKLGKNAKATTKVFDEIALIVRE